MIKHRHRPNTDSDPSSDAIKWLTKRAFVNHLPTNKQAYLYPSPIGLLKILTLDGCLTDIIFLAKDQPVDTAVNDAPSPLQAQIAHALTQYFADPHYQFSVPLHLTGTPYQRRVWQFLTTIPPGQTLTYGQVAAALKSHPRAVGQACRRNPVPIIIPCHRVTAANHLGGYTGELTGEMLQVKAALLGHEGK